MVFLGLLLFLQKAATGTTIVLDFEGFSDGTILGNDYPNLTFNNAIILTAGIGLNEIDFPPHSGSNVASDNGGAVTITFASPVLSFSSYFTYAIPLALTAFDSGNNPVAHASSLFSANYSSSGNPPNELLSVSFASGISTVMILGEATGGSFVMDDTSYSTAGQTATPEPSSVILILTGVGALLPLRKALNLT